jgi:transposase InsO family protein/predicted aspartyl protease
MRQTAEGGGRPEAAGKLKRVGALGRPSTCNREASKNRVVVASLCQGFSSIYVDGAIDGEPSAMLVDTGATRTIVRPDLIKGRPLTTTVWRLRTATGAGVNVHGEIDVRVTMGSTVLDHCVLVAEIEETVILGMDLMSRCGVQLDLENGILNVNKEELVLNPRRTVSVCATAVADMTLKGRSETFVLARLEGNLPDGSVVMLEPENSDEHVGRGILIAKQLLLVKDTVPVRLMNINSYPKSLKEGTVLGKCVTVSSIHHQARGVRDDPATEVSPKLMRLMTDASRGRNSHQRKRIEDMFLNFRDVFDLDDGNKGRSKIVRHTIDTGDAKPIRQTPRRLPLAKREEAERILREMQGEGVVETSNSPWASPVVLVKKKDGSTRFCVDYRKLNDATRKDSYPLPRIDDTLDTLAGSKIFSTLDLKSGYWQVELAPEDKEKTAFTLGSGLWQFTVMPFGLCNAPATFERLMDNILKGLSWKTCLIYLDDIIVVGKSFEDHMINLKNVFQRLREASLKLSPKKCCFFRSEVLYLGHVVSDHGISVDTGKTKAIEDWPVPRDKHQLRSFLGLCTYYRRFVMGFASIAKPLTKLTEEARKFDWDQSCQRAFEQLKKALLTSPILGYPNEHGNFVLDTDASNYGIGGILSQLQDGQERVIGYFSKTLSKPERNYCVTRRELLAVVKSVEHFYKYLYGRKFLLRTDHAALKWLMQFKNPEGQVARWIERLQEYDFEIEHRAGTRHNNADALSRRPCSKDCKHCNRAEEQDSGAVRLTTVIDEAWQPGELHKYQQADPDLQLIRDWKESGQKPTWNQIAPHTPSVKSYWAQWDSLVIDDDGLIKRVVENDDGTEEKRQLLVPSSRRAEVLQQLHDGSAGGHLGVHKTLEKVRSRFYWNNLKDDVRDWCRKCTICAASNGPPRRPKAPMQQYNVGSPFERIAIDIAGPFPETDHQNKYILVVMDYFSKWVEAYALPNQEATTVADVLVKEWICRFGVPLELHSDQGRNFESALFQGVCQILGIRKTRTTPLHPQSDGMVERMNRTLNRYLSKVVSDHQRDWDQHLHLFLMAYRSSAHETTGQSPANIAFGRELRLPCDLKFGCKPGENLANDDYVANLRRKMDDIHRRVRVNIERASDRMKDRYDIRAQDGGYQTGDRVWLFDPKRRRGLSPKLQNQWDGPYEIVKRINDVVYRVRKMPRGKAKVVHFNRLTPYEGEDREERVAQMECPQSFTDFMARDNNGRKERFGVTIEEHRDIFRVDPDYALAHCISQDLKMNKGIAAVFKVKFGGLEKLLQQDPEVGDVLSLDKVFHLVTKEKADGKPTYWTLWRVLQKLKNLLLERQIRKLAIPRLGSGLDRLNWRIVRNMLENIFKDTEVKILVCHFNPRSSGGLTTKRVGRYFFRASGCITDSTVQQNMKKSQEARHRSETERN